MTCSDRKPPGVGRGRGRGREEGGGARQVKGIGRGGDDAGGRGMGGGRGRGTSAGRTGSSRGIKYQRALFLTFCNLCHNKSIDFFMNFLKPHFICFNNQLQEFKSKHHHHGSSNKNTCWVPVIAGIPTHGSYN